MTTPKIPPIITATETLGGDLILHDKRNEDGSFSFGRVWVAHYHHDGIEAAIDEADAIAARIVQSWNHYDRLIAAIDEIVGEWDLAHADEDQATGYTTETEGLKMCREALRCAEARI